MSFEQLALHAALQKAIRLCGYTQPTPVQAKAIPVVLEGKDLVASAQTGTGKTAAFVLPALNLLMGQPASKKPRILILTPTRELAQQVTKAAAQYGKFSHFKIVSLVGGMSYEHQIRDLSRGVDIIVATPGRLIDHIESKRVDLSQIQMLVLDEADRMLDMGFIDDVSRIAKLTSHARQTLLFSATIDKQINTVIKQLLKNPVRIDLSVGKLTAPKIKQEAYRTKNMHQKTQLLKHFLANEPIYKAIVFSATKSNADKLADDLNRDGFAVSALHGDLRQNVRNRVVEKFKRGQLQFLIATDVAARGIHVNDVTHVINYDLPKFAEDYVHRIGRTGRAGKEGTAISFVSPTDAQHLSRIEKYIGERIKVHNHVELPKETATEDGKPVKKNPHLLKERPKTDDERRPHFKNNNSHQRRSRGPSFHEGNFEEETTTGEKPKRRRPFKKKPFAAKSFGAKPFASKQRFQKRRDKKE